MTRVRHAERPPVEERRPLYARLLRLHHLTPSGFLCFVFLEGAIALGLLLALAELVSWWGVLVLPALVALMVKLNDVIAGSLARAAQPAHSTANHRTRADPTEIRPPRVRLTETHHTEPGPAVAPGPVLRSAADPSVEAPMPATYAGGPAAGMPPPAASAGGPAAGIPMAEDATTRLPGMIGRSPGGQIKRPWAERVEAQEQWLRQSATRRYE